MDLLLKLCTLQSSADIGDDRGGGMPFVRVGVFGVDEVIGVVVFDDNCSFNVFTSFSARVAL